MFFTRFLKVTAAPCRTVASLPSDASRRMRSMENTGWTLPSFRNCSACVRTEGSGESDCCRHELSCASCASSPIAPGEMTRTSERAVPDRTPGLGLREPTDLMKIALYPLSFFRTAGCLFIKSAALVV